MLTILFAANFLPYYTDFLERMSSQAIINALVSKYKNQICHKSEDPLEVFQMNKYQQLGGELLGIVIHLLLDDDSVFKLEKGKLEKYLQKCQISLMLRLSKKHKTD